MALPSLCASTKPAWLSTFKWWLMPDCLVSNIWVSSSTPNVSLFKAFKICTRKGSAQALSTWLNRFISKRESALLRSSWKVAFDNSVSKKSAAIKGVKNIVAGDADVLLVPSVETGNSLVKMMIYFMGACAAGVVVGGKVPIVITSRSDEAQARLASIAAAVVALD